MLFNLSDNSPGYQPEQNLNLVAPGAAHQKNAESLELQAKYLFLEGDKRTQLENKIGLLNFDTSIFFKTDGAWNAIDLIEYILAQTGTADVFFSTWSIGPEAIRRFNKWQELGKIKTSFGIIDKGFKNRKPDLYHQSINTFSNLKFSENHAKVTVIQSKTHNVTLMGSANLTVNRRTEVGVIILDKTLADKNIQWILEGVAHD